MNRLGFIKLFNLFFIVTPPAVIITQSTLSPSSSQYDPSQKVGAALLQDDFIAEYELDDPRLIAHIRKYYLIPPSQESYALDYPNAGDWSQKGQSKIVDSILGGKRNGFFFEAGAYDGETYSNSLYFEKHLNWTGLLVEPSVENFEILLKKNRKKSVLQAWLVPGCVGTGSRAQRVEFTHAMDVGGVGLSRGRGLLTRLWRPFTSYKVWCFPFPSLMKAIGREKVDYLVLDTEGSELDILPTIPWKTVDPTVLQVEYASFHGLYWDKDLSQKRKKLLEDFVKDSLPQMTKAVSIWIDIIFSKKNLPAQDFDIESTSS